MIWKFLLILLILDPHILFAQDQDLNKQIQQLSFFSSTDTQDYRLGPGDLIEIKVFEVDKFDQLVRISSSGTVTIPFLGKVPAAGRTGAELEAQLAGLINSRKLIRNPQVSVFVKEYRSQPVFVLGAVNQPGQYMIVQQLNLIDIIAMAGGLAPRADEVATIQRAHSGTTPDAHDDSESQIIEINLTSLLDKGELGLNLRVQGGDVIHIPEREVKVYYVIGEVMSPGAYQLPADRTLLLTQALAQAGGPMKTAKMNSGLLVRYDEQGTRQELAVNFSDLLKGKKADFPIQSNDVIFIPGSNFKNIGYGLLGSIPSTITRIPTEISRRRRY